MLVPLLADLDLEASRFACDFPELALPFMVQAGIGLYAVGRDTGRIYEWDSEAGDVSASYETVEEVLDEWLAAVG